MYQMKTQLLLGGKQNTQKRKYFQRLIIQIIVAFWKNSEDFERAQGYLAIAQLDGKKPLQSL